MKNKLSLISGILYILASFCFVISMIVNVNLISKVLFGIAGIFMLFGGILLLHIYIKK